MINEYIIIIAGWSSALKQLFLPLQSSMRRRRDFVKQRKGLLTFTLISLRCTYGGLVSVLAAKSDPVRRGESVFPSSKCFSNRG